MEAQTAQADPTKVVIQISPAANGMLLSATRDTGMQLVVIEHSADLARRVGLIVENILSGRPALHRADEMSDSPQRHRDAEKET
jgi:hypothetical protein